MRKFYTLPISKLCLISNADASKIMAGRRHAGEIRLGIEEDDDDRYGNFGQLSYLIRISRLKTR